MRPQHLLLLLLNLEFGTGASPPNVLFFLSESLDGRLLRPDSPAKIPNIRALQARGVTFDTAYSNNPVCAPSRSSLWSGRAPHRIPHTHNGFFVPGVYNNYEGLPPPPSPVSVRLDQLLARSAANFSVQIAGKTDWDIGSHTETCLLSSISFNVRWPYNITADGGWNEEDSTCATPGPVEPGGSAGPSGSAYGNDWRLVARTSAFVASAPQPFFANLATSILHPPYATTQYWYDRTPADLSVGPAWAPLSALHPCDLQAAMKRGCTPGELNASAHAAFYDEARRRRVRRIYLAELEEYDAMVGAVVASLGARAADTLIILAADHGDMQLEHQFFYKMMPYDGSARIPLVVAGAGVAEPGRTVAQPVQLLDILPTVLTAAGVAVPAYADGYALQPFLAGAAADPARPPAVASQNHDEDISMSWFMATDGAYKLVQYGTGEQVPAQLFNMTADPAEMVNLLVPGDAAAKAIAARLDALLRAEIDYPSVAREVALYQRQQFGWWVSNQTDWKKEIASGDVRWQQAWARHPEAALAAAEAFLATNGSLILACDGSLANI